MQINKGNILKSIESFIGADNELAIKEAEHQIKVFEVVYQKEIENFQEKGEEGEKEKQPKEKKTRSPQITWRSMGGPMFSPFLIRLGFYLSRRFSKSLWCLATNFG